MRDGLWVEEGKIVGMSFLSQFKQNIRSLGSWLTIREDGNAAGEIWAIALSEDGQYLASTTYNGRINVWDCLADHRKIREYETKGSFGMAIDLVGISSKG